ncbi:iron(III) transport system ATP-binding protein/NitT/TauT family transport system ATP-binding protein/putative spermidine/putrescine transport system ATP-binding protein [Nitrosomonas marina]|uniref:Iron(III) transport system ATP-binding protein/NitT/TauT family transport system ATP-binding protein/putative spermidine/putrescine transport system ATP-binding protein n=1 Tax=Nitrosomonas marina TaxID=917 RepID=A0A1I0FUP8_9PROT|nr:ATP-binding cassette domain-containing protein [Nitrosomonas marina]SET61982.1 iron(III) transport system ATP-binding protein/NitT/TauT family transport system ATP-binding protein/putative spermidine/putrescine transport system ATP-binding protein [Nitrosomonas marina]
MILEIKNFSLCIKNKKRTKLIGSFNLDLAQGEVVSVLGLSGVGKSALTTHIFGLNDNFESEGIINWKKTDKNCSKNIASGYVSQTDPIFPWFSVSDFVSMCAHDDPSKITAIKETMSDFHVSYETFGNKKAGRLSGGERGRISLAAAIHCTDYRLLLDEPFSHIDEIRKNEYIEVFKKIQNQRQLTTFIVTHSSKEAGYLSDKIVLLRGPDSTDHKIIDGYAKQFESMPAFCESSLRRLDIEISNFFQIRKELNL